MAGAQPRTSSRSIFKQSEILPVPCQYKLLITASPSINGKLLKQIHLYTILIQGISIIFLAQMSAYLVFQKHIIHCKFMYLCMTCFTWYCPYDTLMEPWKKKYIYICVCVFRHVSICMYVRISTVTSLACLSFHFPKFTRLKEQKNDTPFFIHHAVINTWNCNSFRCDTVRSSGLSIQKKKKTLWSTL
jgi:hypothetical protein